MVMNGVSSTTGRAIPAAVKVFTTGPMPLYANGASCLISSNFLSRMSRRWRMRRFLLSGSLAAWVALVLACGGAGTKTDSKDTKQSQAKNNKTGGKKDSAKEPSEPSAKERWIALGSPSLNLKALKAGDLGVMPVGEYMQFGERKTKPTGWKVLQVLDAENALMTHFDGFYKEVNGEAFWFEMGTDGLVDGRIHTFDGIWECKGTRRYNSAVGGTRTVFVLRYCGKE
jgi:hypothetical protein